MSSASLGSTEQDRSNVVNDLVATYRELNLRIRPLSESQLAADRGGSSIKSLVGDLRDEEVAFAQLLKEEVTGITVDEALLADAPRTQVESGEDSTAMIISQFGTARATTLSLLKSLDDAGWDKPTAEGKTIYQLATATATRDKSYLDRILSGQQGATSPQVTGSSFAAS
ncbi:MAG TPA: hypothetical protein VFQ54_02890 [Thermomicrobiales bacterium]|nr:hypothetical protein [Thermomicrobiales bacterium]